jgi:hypothetical protein
MLKTCSFAAAAVFALTTLSMPAFADGKNDCTTEAKEKWKPQPDAEAAAKAAGYEVRRSKIEGSCYGSMPSKMARILNCSTIRWTLSWCILLRNKVVYAAGH